MSSKNTSTYSSNYFMKMLFWTSTDLFFFLPSILLLFFSLYGIDPPLQFNITTSKEFVFEATKKMKMLVKMMSIKTNNLLMNLNSNKLEMCNFKIKIKTKKFLKKTIIK